MGIHWVALPKRKSADRRAKGEYTLKTHWDIGNISACGKRDLPKEVLLTPGSEITCKVCPRYKRFTDKQGVEILRGPSGS